MMRKKSYVAIAALMVHGLLLGSCNTADSDVTATRYPDESQPPDRSTASPTITSESITPDGVTHQSTPDRFAGEPGSIMTFQLRPDGNVSYVWSITTATDDSLWFGGVMGAVQFNGETWTVYGMDQGLPNDNVQAIVVADDDSLWFATLGGGVSRLKDHSWKNISTLNGLVDDSITCAFAASNGDLWFGTYDGISRFDGDRWQNYTQIHGLADDTVNAIIETPDGAIWFATNHGLSRFDGVNWWYYGEKEGFQGGVAQALAVTVDGTLWVGTHGTLNHFDGHTWEYFTQDNGLADARIDALFGASDGSLWVGTIAGISRRIDDRWINYSHDNDLNIFDIQAIQEDKQGAIWITGGYNYIYRFIPPSDPETTVTVENASNQIFNQPTIPLTDEQILTIEQIEMIDERMGWSIGGTDLQQGHVLRTDDGGSTWYDVSPPALRSLSNAPADTSAFFYDSDNAWIVYNDSAEVWSTSNGAQSWNSAQIDFPRSRSDRLFFTDPYRGWLLRHVESGMGNQYVALYRTIDAGLSWEKLIDPYTDEDLQGCLKTGMVFREAEGWMTYDCQGIYPQALLDWTTDGGQTWQPVWLPYPNADIEDDDGYCTTKDPYRFSATHGALLVECYRFSESKTSTRYLYQTSDNGTNWKITEFPGSELYFIDEQSLFSLGQDISFSTNQGQDWTAIKSVQWQGQFNFFDENQGWAVARYEDQIALVHTQDGGRTWQEIKPVISTAE